ncbi:prolactin-inducible protein [Suricata suricatta]|uniref:Prolactin-inducible protein homolog n=1 Tax=Suricata suricatta TaxID=37032 RepID=A0A673SN22_SURSU|nr:prolactin-inducible protein [Suricata suricatta]
MHFLQLLFRANSAVLLLVFCLQLWTNKAQENTRRVIILNAVIPNTAHPNEEFTVTITVGTELRECIVVKASLVSRTPIEGSFNYKYTVCICKDYPRTLFWDIAMNQTAKIAAVAQIVREKGICPNDEAVVPVVPKTAYTVEKIHIV